MTANMAESTGDGADLILSLTSTTASTGLDPDAPQNARRIRPDHEDRVGYDRDVTPGLSQMARTRIDLRFSAPPKDLQEGFSFGRNSAICDVVFNELCISQRHFTIRFNIDRQLLLTDRSRHGTKVIFEGDLAEIPKHGTWTLTPGILTTIHLPNGIEYVVEIPQHSSEQALYNSKLDKYFQDAGLPLAPLATLNMKSQVTTVAPSPRAVQHVQAAKYKQGRQLGKGSDGTVYLVTNIQTGIEYAKKVYCHITGTAAICATREASNLQAHRHSHLVEYVESGKQGYFPYIIMEYVPHGTLEDHCHDGASFRHSEIATLLDQCLQALDFLHQRGSAHRDVKPSNILLKTREPIHIKLADFAYMSQRGDFKTYCGTQMYLAPEINKKKSIYGVEVDLWSLGVVMLQVLSSFGDVWRKAHVVPKGRSHARYMRSMLDSLICERQGDQLLGLVSLTLLRMDPKERKPAGAVLEQLRNLQLRNDGDETGYTKGAFRDEEQQAEGSTIVNTPSYVEQCKTVATEMGSELKRIQGRGEDRRVQCLKRSHDGLAIPLTTRVTRSVCRRNSGSIG